MSADATRPGAGEPPMLVKNAASSHFSAVDPATRTVVGSVGEGRYPHTALFHPDLPVAYLVYISSAHVEVVDLEALETVQRVDDVGTAPIGSTIGPAGERAFVGTAVDLPDEAAPGVAAFDVAADGTLELAGQRPLSRCSGMRIGPDDRLYVGQARTAELLALTADADLELHERYGTGEKPHDCYVLPGDDCVFVNNAHESHATVVDVAAGTVRSTPATGENPHGFAVAEGPAGRSAVVPAREDERVAVVDLDAAVRGAEAPTERLVDVGTTTGFAATTADGRYALLDSYDHAHVTILDLASASVAARVEVGGEPLHVVFGEDEATCFVGNMARPEVAVLDTAPLAEGRPGDVTVADRIEGLGDKPSGIFRPEVTP